MSQGCRCFDVDEANVGVYCCELYQGAHEECTVYCYIVAE